MRERRRRFRSALTLGSLVGCARLSAICFCVLFSTKAAAQSVLPSEAPRAENRQQNLSNLGLPDSAQLPATRLPEADLTSLDRIDALLESGKIDEAIDLLVESLAQESSAPVLVQSVRISSDNLWGQRYLTIDELTQRRFAQACITHPEWLEAYRRRVDRQAKVLLQAARERGDLDAEAKLLSQFLLASDAASGIELLADRLLESGRSLEAWDWYDRLLESPTEDSVNESNQTSREDEDSSSIALRATRDLAPSISYAPGLAEPTRQRLAYKRMVAAWNSGHHHAARQMWLEQEAAKQNGAGSPTPVTSVIQGQATDLRQWSGKRVGFDPERPLEELRAIGEEPMSDTAAPLNLSQWTLAWSNSLQLPINHGVDRRLELDNVGAGGSRWCPQIRVLHDGQSIVAFDGNRLRAWDRDSGEPWIALTDEIDSDPLRRGMLWELAEFQRASLDQRPIEGAARYEVFGGGGLWGVRGGDPRSIVQDTTTRVRSWWTGFDVRRDAALLPNTPWVLASGLEWEGNPVFRDGLWWGAQRESSPRDERSRTWLVAFSTLAWSASENAQLPIVFRVELSEGANLGRGQVHECSHVQPAFDSRHVYVAGPTGSITAVDRREGTARWWFTYPQAQANAQSRWESREFRWREGGDVWSDGRMVVALPADSDRAFALDARDGRLLWSVALPAASYVVGREGQWLILGGPQLVWVDALTGTIAQRYPNLPASQASPAQTWSAPLFGHAQLSDGRVWCSTQECLCVIGARLEPKTYRDGSVGWSVRELEKVDWSLLEIGPGDLRVEEGRVWVSSDQKVGLLRRP